MRKALSEEKYEQLNTRMIRWYGDACGDVDDYQLWASARLLHLDKDPNRVLRPEDLHTRVRDEWLERLEQCATIEDAETVVS